MARSLGFRDNRLGNMDLRGKKTKLLLCRCCFVEDIKGRLDKREAAKLQRLIIRDK